MQNSEITGNHREGNSQSDDDEASQEGTEDDDLESWEGTAFVRMIELRRREVLRK